MSARSSDGKNAAVRGARQCPICGKPQDGRFKPFCSKRCADIDLSRWLKGVYAVPTDKGPDETGAAAEEGEEEA
ncbi:MAG: DNA gyrase inhibitor YacG [Rhizomicrobium sp.]